MAREVANSASSLAKLQGMLLNDYKRHKYLRVTWTTSRERSLDQNALWAAMYQRISDSLGDGTAFNADYYRAECKLFLGVPILYRDCEQFRKGWDDLLACKTYEQQLKLMGPNALFGPNGFPVTSLMSTKQGAEYTDAIVKKFGPYYVFFDDLLNG
jgi:hypothetical protein